MMGPNHSPAGIGVIMRILRRLLLCSIASLPAGASGADSQATEPPVIPQGQTASDLLKTCDSSMLTHSGRLRRGYCSGFVSGVEETLRTLPAGEHQRRICVPPKTSSTRLVGLFTDYLVRNRGAMDRPAVQVVRMALEAAFPCASDI
jgi:hypothetical protein